MDKKEQIEKAEFDRAIEILKLYNESQIDLSLGVVHHNVLCYNINLVTKYLSQPKEEPKKEVDLEELRELFEDWYFLTEESCLTHGKEFNHNSIFDFFLPHLQKPVESDGVEFAEWMGNNWVKLNDKGWMESDLYTKIEVTHTTNDIYEQFKQLKK